MIIETWFMDLCEYTAQEILNHRFGKHKQQFQLVAKPRKYFPQFEYVRPGDRYEADIREEIQLSEVLEELLKPGTHTCP